MPDGARIMASMARKKPITWRDLFHHGEKGAVYDFSVLSNSFTDTGMTTPVTTNGQNISSFLDLSGCGNHQILIATRTALVMNTAGSYNSADTGANNSLGGYQTAAGSGITGKKLTAIFGLMDASPAQEGWLCSQETDVTADCFMLGIDAGFANAAQVSIEGGNPSGGSSRSKQVTTGAPTITESLSGFIDLAGTTYANGMDLRVNGSNASVTTNAAWTTPTGTTWDGTKKLAFGCVVSAGTGGGVYRALFNARIRRAVIVNRALTAAEYSAIEAWVIA